MRKKRFFAVAVGRGPSRTFYVPCPTLLRPKSYSSLTQVLKIGEQTRTNYGFGTAKIALRHIPITDYEYVTAVIGQSGHKWTNMDKCGQSGLYWTNALAERRNDIVLPPKHKKPTLTADCLLCGEIKFLHNLKFFLKNGSN